MWRNTHSGDWSLVFTLVVPELGHCVLFGGFLMQWLQHFKQAAVDPIVSQAVFTL